MLFCKSISFLGSPCFLVQSNRFFSETLFLEVNCRSESDFLWTGHAQTDDFTIQLIINCNFYSLRVILGFCVEMNSLA
jgi:hypothetical protein